MCALPWVPECLHFYLTHQKHWFGFTYLKLWWGGGQTSACSLLKRHLRLQRGRRRKKKKDGGIREEAYKEREGGKKKKKTQANVGAFQITTYPRDREWRDGGMKGRAKSMSHAERWGQRTQAEKIYGEIWAWVGIGNKMGGEEGGTRRFISILPAMGEEWQDKRKRGWGGVGVEMGEVKVRGDEEIEGADKKCDVSEDKHYYL